MTSVLVVDDHEIVRRGLREVLVEGLAGARVAEAGNAAEALDRLDQEPRDLMLLDIALPGRSGLELLEDARRLHPALRVLVVSGYPEEEFAVRSIRLGAAGYVTKSTASRELLEAARHVLAGRRFVSASLAQRLADLVGGTLRDTPHAALSARELEVLKRVACGRTLKEIAGELRISEKTVATYRARVSEKLGLSRRVELTRYAIQHRLVD